MSIFKEWVIIKWIDKYEGNNLVCNITIMKKILPQLISIRIEPIRSTRRKEEAKKMINFTQVDLTASPTMYDAKLESLGVLDIKEIIPFPKKNWAIIEQEYNNKRLDMDSLKIIVNTINMVIKDVGLENDRQMLLGGYMIPTYINAMLAQIYGDSHEIFHLMEFEENMEDSEEINFYLLATPKFKARRKK